MNNNNYSLQALARLASHTLQRRLIVNGTKNFYLLPTEIIEDVLALRDRIAAQGEPFLPGLNAGERARVALCLSRIETLLAESPQWQPDDFPNEVLIEEEPLWSALRAEAAACLAEVDFSLSEWEEEQDSILIELLISPRLQTQLAALQRERKQSQHLLINDILQEWLASKGR